MESVGYPTTSHMNLVFPCVVTIQYFILYVRRKFVISNVYTSNNDGPVFLHSGCVISWLTPEYVVLGGNFNIVWSPSHSLSFKAGYCEHKEMALYQSPNKRININVRDILNWKADFGCLGQTCLRT